MSQNYQQISQLKPLIDFDTIMHKSQSPQNVEQVATGKEAASMNQEIEGIAHSVFLSDSLDVPRAVVFFGADRSGVSSDLCIELGRVLAANSGKSVCVVDAHVPPSPFAHFFKSARSASGSVHDRTSPLSLGCNLWLAPLELTLQSEVTPIQSVSQVKGRLAELQGAFQFVLIDAPNLSDSSAAGILGQAADAAILVVEANSTRKAAARRAKQAMEAMNVRLLGAVLHNRTFPIPEKLYRIL